MNAGEEQEGSFEIQHVASTGLFSMEYMNRLANAPLSEREVEVYRLVDAFTEEIFSEERSLEALVDCIREGGEDGELLWAYEDSGPFERRSVLQMCCQALSQEELVAFFRLLLLEYPGLRTKKGGEQGDPLLYKAISLGAPVLIALVATSEAAVTANTDGDTPLHSACCGLYPVPIYEFLVNLNADALSIQNRDGNLPIHCAFGQISVIGAEALRVMVNAHPAALAVRNNEGQLSLHLACNQLRRLDELEEAERALEALEVLIDARPDALVERDNSGNTPIATAIEPDHSMDAWMRRLVHQDSPPDRTERTRRVIQFVMQRMLPRAPTSGLRDALTVDGVVGALSKVCKENPDLELASMFIELWILAVCLSQFDPVREDYELTSESRLMLLALVEILLHDTTKGAVPDPVRDHVRQSVISDTSADELTSNRGVVQAIHELFLGEDLQQLRSLILRFPPLLELLTHPLLSGDALFQNFLVGVYLMNKAGRHHVRSPERQDGGGPDTKAYQHLRVLMAAIDNPSCLFLHLRDCDVLFARYP